MREEGNDRSRRVQRNGLGVRRSFRVALMTGRQRGVPTWSANSAKMVNLLVNLLSYGKYVRGILRMTIGCAATVRMTNM